MYISFLTGPLFPHWSSRKGVSLFLLLFTANYQRGSLLLGGNRGVAVRTKEERGNGLFRDEPVDFVCSNRIKISICQSATVANLIFATSAPAYARVACARGAVGYLRMSYRKSGTRGRWVPCRAQPQARAGFRLGCCARPRSIGDGAVLDRHQPLLRALRSDGKEEKNARLPLPRLPTEGTIEDCALRRRQRLVERLDGGFCRLYCL